MSNGNVNDLELAKFIELAGQYGIRVHILHGDGWLPPVANIAALPAIGNEIGDIRQLLDTGIPYRWDGDSWEPWGTSGAKWGGITGTLASQTDLQNALNAKMGAGAYVLVSQNSALANQTNLGGLTSGLLMSTVSGGISTITIVTNNSANWNTAFTHTSNTSNPHSVTKSQVGLGNVDNTSDVNKPVSTAQATADTAALNAAKAYADGLVVGLIDDRGNYNASVNTFPASGGSGTAGAILKGDLWTISVAGTLGGVAVTPGDIVRAIVDTPAQTAANWAIAETNIGYTPENSTNKATTMTGNTASNTLYLTAKAIYDWAIALFVQSNGAIVGATKTKVTYDAKGLVTAGADATTADIADSTNKRYVTDANLTTIANQSGTNSGNETTSTIGTLINGSTDQPTPADTDIFAISISSALRKVTFANLKGTIKTYYDAVAATLTNKDISSATNTYRAGSLTVTGALELATTAEIDTGSDSTRAMPVDQFVASKRNVRYFDIYAVDKATDNAVGTNIIGSIECPFTGTITEIGAYVETAGVTGTSVWDVNKNGTTLMTTSKLSIDTAEVSTRTAVTAPALTTTAIAAGDLITIDTDSLSTTKPKGLHVRIGIRLS